ncbi:hypothetical protein BLNAU_25003 [Blattamonas nauphoetae]|uniref:Uncharacterized protein n=1 Tax=Blattamonas nauphoetae TaxID=2049346 RepID=A0ABQ9WNN5_9EUKA|nr:hypothetical protein BLNAU_25003 [Blattamonas nauphoetae]
MGCVVSLTSSHLSGSTIRDVNIGGSVLCSNCSFSSLLPSPNAECNTGPDSSEGTVLLPGSSTPVPFVDGGDYRFKESSGNETTKAVFTNCRFTELAYPGAIFVLSCSFSDSYYKSYGGAIFDYIDAQYNHTSLTITSSNFTHCSAKVSGGAVYHRSGDDVVISSCRFVDCSVQNSYAHGGAIDLDSSDYGDSSQKQVKVVDCFFADCYAVARGPRIHHSSFSFGGGLYVDSVALVTVERTHFIECQSAHGGGALTVDENAEVRVSDILVQNCYSGTTGAICIIRYSDADPLSLSHVYFVGNSIGASTTVFTSLLKFPRNTPRFRDIAILHTDFTVMPTITTDGCFTNIIPDSVGMVIGRTYNSSTSTYDPELCEHEEFEKIGPLLTAKPTVRMNVKTRKIELEMKGMTPPISQEYEVTVKADGNETETRLRILFSNGVGTLVSGSDVTFPYNTGYTIISIVGIVPEPSSSSSSRMTNAIEVPAVAWPFNLAATPNYLTFTTPEEPSTLTWATSNLISDESKFAYVILLFSKEVCGSFDIVVLENGKDVTITVSLLEEAQAGESSKFIVVGEDRLLTQDTTYTIQSIVPTPGTDSPFMFMNKTITFHIPKSSYVPPVEPEEPEDPKKTLSPEMKKLLSWLLPLVACLLVGLVLAIIIIVLLRRRQKKKSEPAQKEMEAQEAFEVEKVEEFGVDCSHGMIRTDGNNHSAFGSSDDHPTKLDGSSGVVESQSRKEGELVEVMACNGGFEISSAPMTNTLYSVLHKEHREIGKRGVGIQIVNGLKQIVAHRGWSDVLTRLSSHWILIDASGNVQLKLQMNASEAEQEAAHAQIANPDKGGNENEPTVNEASERTEHSEKDKTGMDGMRWRAPEVVAGGGRGGEVDGQKASVFSLGLVLWEIETDSGVRKPQTVRKPQPA